MLANSHTVLFMFLIRGIIQILFSFVIIFLVKKFRLKSIAHVFKYKNDTLHVTGWVDGVVHGTVHLGNLDIRGGEPASLSQEKQGSITASLAYFHKTGVLSAQTKQKGIITL